jgi:hypothetical protein
VWLAGLQWRTAKWCAVAVEMPVRINEPRGDQLPPGIMRRAGRVLLAQARPNREDDAIGHRHVPILVIDLVCRVDDAAPGDEQVARGERRRRRPVNVHADASQTLHTRSSTRAFLPAAQLWLALPRPAC